MDEIETLALPEDPTLAMVSEVLNGLGHSAMIADSKWTLVFATDEMRRQFRDTGPSTSFGIGEHWFGPTETTRRQDMFAGDEELEVQRGIFRYIGPYVLADTPGGRDQLRGLVDPRIQDLVDQIEPAQAPAAFRPPQRTLRRSGSGVGSSPMYLRVRGDDGAFAGTVLITKPQAGMSRLEVLAGIVDVGLLERLAVLEEPGRRPSAILMADIEGSSLLARRLPSAQYFAFARRLVREIDRCVVDHCGVVGRHVGDGVVAFFPADSAGSESLAAQRCIETARAIQGAIPRVAERSDLPLDEISVRFGLHWGATLYMGLISTAGRSEVNALGDEINEAARIEACATGARTLASKQLIERLSDGDAQTLEIDPDRLLYTQLADLTTATDKARRDAPSIAVSNI